MIYIASCSFGKDSLASVILAHIHGEPLDIVLYSEVMYDKNTSAEIPEHHDFIYNVAIPKLEEWGYKVVVARTKKNFKDIFFRVRKKSKNKQNVGKIWGFPLSGTCYVMPDIKMLAIKQFMRTLKGEEVISYVGIATDEKKRLKRLAPGKVSLLAKYGYTEEMAKELCRQYGLLSPIYQFVSRGGCFFCPNASKKAMRHLYDKHQDLFEDLEKMERIPNKIGEFWGAYQAKSLGRLKMQFEWDDAQPKLF